MFSHVVMKGQSLSRISEMYNVSMDMILAVNPNITNPDQIFIGQVIQIPYVQMMPMMGMEQMINPMPQPQSNPLMSMQQPQMYPMATPQMSPYQLGGAEQMGYPSMGMNPYLNVSPHSQINPYVQFNPYTNISPDTEFNPMTSISPKTNIEFNPKTQLQFNPHLDFDLSIGGGKKNK